ncbi:MAG: ester cyclase [Actinomycetota bacterium]
MDTAREANKDMVRRLVGVINEWHLEDLDELFEPSSASKARGDFESFHAAFPDWRMDLLELIAEGDTVVARFRCHGTNEGPWQDAPATGKKMSVDEVFFFRFRNGRIRSSWGLEDTWARMNQLGLVR